ncbi:MAG TPA: SDR family oxidoreductase [Terriglobales bacterium]|nr:SDR family oxidoreductase [Terriglobales bacterium]
MRNVLVTGASGALGGAVARAFEANGDRVIKASHPAYDLTKPEDAARAVAGVEGGLAVVVHVVGAFAGGQPVAATDDATWRAMMSINLDAAFYVARAAVPRLTAEPGGRLIMIGSRNAVSPAANLAAYNASKAGLVSLVQTLALEIAERGATANVVLPSVIDTPANRGAMPKADASRWVKPDEIAALIVWLASDAAQAVSGAAIPMYGRA